MSQAAASDSAGPLAGVRVLDMSRLLPGPFCTQLLCDMGAEVIKIEDPEGGDYARMYPPLMSDGNSAIFHALNRGKKSVCLDLKQPAQLQQFLALLGSADVLVETFRPGVMHKLGIGPASLLARFPSLIICSISGYGQTGPDALRAGHDINYLAKSGALGVMARPSLLPVQVADIAGGSYPAAVQILAALRARDRTGRGSLIDVSMTDNVYSLLTMPLARHSASGAAFSGGLDWLTGATPCYEVYPTADGFLSVGALEPKFWDAFCKTLKREDLIPLQFPEAGSAALAEVKAEVGAILAAKPNAHWSSFFQSKDCCVEVVARPEDVLQRDAHLASRGLTLQLRFPASGADGPETLTCAKTPLRMTGVSCSDKPAPGLGEHNDLLLIKSKL